VEGEVAAQMRPADLPPLRLETTHLLRRVGPKDNAATEKAPVLSGRVSRTPG
jgi:hypothetical protein